jgi:hypothetical protein
MDGNDLGLVAGLALTAYSLEDLLTSSLDSRSTRTLMQFLCNAQQ